MTKSKLLIALLIPALLVIGSLGAFAYYKTQRNTSSKSEITSSTTPTVPPTEEIKFLAFKDTSGKFEIFYPKTWTPSTEKDQTFVVVIRSPKVTEDDSYRENVNVAFQGDLNPGFTLDDFNKNSKENFSSTLKDFKILKEEKIKVDGQEAIELVYTSTVNEKPAKAVQRFILKERGVYVISYTGYLGDYEKFEKDGMKSLDSFNFL